MAKKRKFVEEKQFGLSKKKKVLTQDPKSMVQPKNINSLLFDNSKHKDLEKNISQHNSSKKNLKKYKKQVVEASISSSKISRSSASKQKKLTTNNANEKKDKYSKQKVGKYTKDIKDVNKKQAKVPITKREIKVTPSARFPQKPEDLSSNWKALLKAQGIAQAKRYKKGNTNRAKTALKNDTVSQPEIWFDDVDESLIETNIPVITQSLGNCSGEKENPLVKKKSFEGLTKAVSMDCEMVGVGDSGKDSILARVSIVNQFGKCVYDRYVKPTEKVTDYRTKVSGIRKTDVDNGAEFSNVQKDVSDILKDRILVGHAIHNDLKVLYLDHPHKMIRDTLRYKPFRRLFDGRNPSLKKLTAKVLGVTVQEGEHNSIQDAQAAMRLYTMNKIQWEKEHSAKYISVFKKKKKKNKLADSV